MRQIGRLPIRVGVARVGRTFALGFHVDVELRVLEVYVGPWTLQVEGPQ